MKKTVLVILNWFLVGATVNLLGCSGDPMGMNVRPGSDGGGAPADGGATALVLKGPSKAGTIAISDDDATVAVVNAEDGSVSFFATVNNKLIATVKTGSGPSSVVIGPDLTTAYVANRTAATVVKITGINTTSPQVSAPVAVGAEPTGIALSPSGQRLYIAEFAESSIGVINTSTMVRTSFMRHVTNPRGLAVTNNGDARDDDETVVVPEFYGVPQPGGEGQNDGRRGVVHLYRATDAAELGPITFQPFTNTDPTMEPVTAPNQLYTVAIAGQLIYVPSVSASPAAPLGPNKNVYPVVYIGDLPSKQPALGYNTSMNLAQPVNAMPAADLATRFFLADIVDVAFQPGTHVAYFVARGADVVQRVDFAARPPVFGSAINKQIDVQAGSQCLNPTGIAIKSDGTRAYVNCWTVRRMAVLDLDKQAVAAVVDAVAAAGLINAADSGRWVFFTGRGRYSGNGTAAAEPTENGNAWLTCASCHPDGLSDNITWIFNAGPRQSTSMDGSFSHSPGGGLQKQRIFNWTAVNDELHDVENVLRQVMGGKGAITSSTRCNALPSEVRSVISPQGLGVAGALKQVAGEVEHEQMNNCSTEFDDINSYTMTIQPPRGRRFADPDSVARGAQLFSSGGCVNCHGGAGWTVSNRFYIPSSSNNGPTGLPAVIFAGAMQLFNTFASPNGFQITTQVMAADPTVPGPIPPLQLSCALRNVNTFGIPGNTALSDALEVRAVAFVVNGQNYFRAQGLGGFNVPSLYGMALGAPYLHHGQAATLTELFTDVRWQSHWQAGNAKFLTGDTANQDRIDLINFLLSIDSTTPEQTVPSGWNGGCQCPTGMISC